LKPWGDVSRYAALAASMTEQLGDRFDAEQARYWNCTIGLFLEAEGTAPEEKFALRIADAKLTIVRGEMPEDAVLKLRMSAGTWGAILMGKKKLETAVLTGQIKYEGQAQEGLRLRSAFKI
jgi:alkyl sulfatase BDS1-like metallo-beta-lactamase superfamily hydrolase